MALTELDLCVSVATRAEVAFMVASHYLGKFPGVCVLILKLTSHASDDVGMIIFALPPRETSKRYNANTWELARLWVDDRMPRNTESWFISRAIDYIKRNRKDVECLVSYADPSVGHKGTIYKAANWIEDGRTDEGRKTPRFDYEWMGKKYGRRAHVPVGITPNRIPRVSKARFIYRLVRATPKIKAVKA